MASLFGRLKEGVREPVDIGDIPLLIDGTTAEFQVGPDWVVSMQIVDKMNSFSSPKQYEEIVRLLRKKIGHKNFRVVFLAATLVETLVQNCGVRFHQALASDKFMEEMKGVIKRTDDLRGRDALEARDKVLGLIQQWGEEFLTRHNCTGTELFVQTYRELRVKGVKFPRADGEARPPVFVPEPSTAPVAAPSVSTSSPVKPRSGSTAKDTPAVSTPGSASRLKPEEAPSPDTTRSKGSRRRLHGQLGVLENVAQMLCEMTAAAESKTEFAANEVVAEMVATLRTSEPKLLEMITTADEKTIQTLLEVNDLLQGSLSEYEHVIKHGPRRTAPAPVPAPRSAAVAGGATPVPAGVVAPPKPSFDDDPFASFGMSPDSKPATGTGTGTGTASTPSTTGPGPSSLRNPATMASPAAAAAATAPPVPAPRLRPSVGGSAPPAAAVADDDFFSTPFPSTSTATAPTPALRAPPKTGTAAPAPAAAVPARTGVISVTLQTKDESVSGGSVAFPKLRPPPAFASQNALRRGADTGSVTATPGTGPSDAGTPDLLADLFATTTVSAPAPTTAPAATKGGFDVDPFAAPAPAPVPVAPVVVPVPAPATKPTSSVFDDFGDLFSAPAPAPVLTAPVPTGAMGGPAGPYGSVPGMPSGAYPGGWAGPQAPAGYGHMGQVPGYPQVPAPGGAWPVHAPATGMAGFPYPAPGPGPVGYPGYPMPSYGAPAAPAHQPAGPTATSAPAPAAAPPASRNPFDFF